MIERERERERQRQRERERDREGERERETLATVFLICLTSWFYFVMLSGIGLQASKPPRFVCCYCCQVVLIVFIVVMWIGSKLPSLHGSFV